MKNEKLYKVVLVGLFAALSYVVFTFLQIKIPLPGGDATSIHLGNAVCVIGALLLGGVYGGLGGAIGMTIGDIFDPVYIVYAPKTFVLKLCIGLITGLVAHKIFHISNETDNKKLVSKYTPQGDQPQAIQELVKGINEGKRYQTLLGATGTGKTFTVSNVIKEINKPTLVIAHNKTLAGQL